MGTSPDDFGPSGVALWRDVVADYTLGAHELTILGVICRTLDTIDRLDAEMVGQPLTVAGSMGQMREHPLLSETRQQRIALARLVQVLKLPDLAATGANAGPEPVAAGLRRSAAARAAASARWAR